MADVFISYKRADRAKVQEIVDLLSAEGWSVWWDTRLKGGEQWNNPIRRELRDARCVVAAWSIRSIDPGAIYMQAEAMRALETDRLIGVRIENVGIPIPFNMNQNVDFFDKPASRQRALIEAVRAKLASRSNGKRSPHWKHWRGGRPAMRRNRAAVQHRDGPSSRETEFATRPRRKL